MKHRFLIGGLSVALTVAIAPAQNCVGNQDMFGTFVFSASRGFFTAPLPEPGPGEPVPVFSATAVGQLVKNASGNGPFAVAGRIVADGTGNLVTGPPDATVLSTRAGSYQVNPDCTVTMTIVDGYTQNVLGDVVARTSVTYQGVLRDRNNEASLAQTSQGGGSVIHLARPFLADSCRDSSLSGQYGVWAAGGQVIETVTESGTQVSLMPFSLAARFSSEGLGKLELDLAGSASPMPKRQITGTYRVENDCTGTAKFILDGKTYNVSFVLVRGGVNLGQFSRAAMMLALTDPKMGVAGEAK